MTAGPLRRARRRTWRLLGAGAAMLMMLGVAARLWPKTPLSSAFPQSSAVSTESGELLRLTLAADGQYRLWVRLDDMPARLPAAVLMYEDRWFYRHPGVNPAALARAAVNDALGRRRLGASTVTMQLARLVYRLDSRSFVGKLRQVALALWLEARYGKRDILEAYLNFAPYGGNVEGVGAASWVYFGKPVAQLSVPQVMSLAVIPQNPRERLLSRAAATRGAALDEARRRLWAHWLAAHPQDGGFSGDVAAAIQARGPGDLPFLAPHFTDALLREHSGDLRTTLELSRQRTLERMLHAYIRERSAVGIRNAGALLLEVAAGGAAQVRAYVGSADYRDAAIDGQVNAVVAKRSPGSALKPFIYALALDQGLLHPRTILKDAPTSFGPFSPENFDGRFVGPIAAEEALIRSRNVPAVALASRLSRPGLYDFLKEAGVSRLDSESHYGLALALGGGEVSMEELGSLYAMFLNAGRTTPLQSLVGSVAAPGEQLLSEEASFITLDMLQKNPRPDTGLPAAPAVAWKTGTSWGFHDAWSAAVWGRYVLIVWIGNFDNTANPAFVGVQAAAPLLFRIIDSLRGEGLDPQEYRPPMPRHLARIEVCAASGDLPNAACPQTIATWYIPGKSPIRVSDLHRVVYMNAAGRRVCGAGPGVHEEIYEFWPSELLRLFREAGMPRRVPPPAPDCGAASQAGFDHDAPQILSPLRGAVYSLRLAHLVPLALRANSAAAAQTVYWFADNAYLGRAPQGESLWWLPPRSGRYLLRAVDDSGAADTRELSVDVLP